MQFNSDNMLEPIAELDEERKRLSCLRFALVLVVVGMHPISAVLGAEIIIGPYLVSFELPTGVNGTLIEQYSTETLAGLAYTYYDIVLKNSTNYNKGGIQIFIYKTESFSLLDQVNDCEKEVDRFNPTTTAWRDIDGHLGYVGQHDNYYDACFWPTNNTQCKLFTFLPWNDGALRLIKSIHFNYTQEARA
jgi:nucleoside phosphorylase